jgi:hypothetical protein
MHSKKDSQLRKQKHKATGKPVTDAVIVQTRIDMSPDAMGEMASPLTPVPNNEPGVYSFKTDLSMQGRWLLSIAAKVHGEPPGSAVMKVRPLVSLSSLTS